MLQSNLLVQRRDNRYMSCKHAGIRLILPSACVIGYEERSVRNCEWRNPKEKNKAKLNLTVRDEQRNKLEQMAGLVEILSFAF
jgi:hypothetical protein